MGDRVAKHLVALGVAPDGRVRSLATAIPLNWVPGGWLSAEEARRLVADRLRVVSEWAQYRQSQAVDPETVRVLDALCSGLEQSLRSLMASGLRFSSPPDRSRAALRPRPTPRAQA
jgi:hypothetical protein